TISLYYTIAETLTESRKKDEKKVFNKKHENKLKKTIEKILNSKQKLSKKNVDRALKSIEKDGEIDEIIDADGTMLGSKIPPLDMTLHPKKTLDQTIGMSRVTNDPVTRGYRVYWGESEEKDDNVVSEVNMEDAFGYEETKDKDFKDTVKTLKDMGVDNAVERTKQFGKLKNVKKKNGELKQRIVEKDKLTEVQKEKMVKMVEDIIAKKSKDESDVVGKDSTLSKILMNNLKSIKKLAEKEGISLTQLMKALKNNE
ncbi:hypothetical protein EBU94_06970, partial [bacterium]|nr:hypothetical protein [bacterium]